MSKPKSCHLFDRWNEGHVDAGEWEQHRQQCPTCRAQSTLDHALRRQLETLPRPQLSSEFEHRLLAKIQATRHPEQMPSRAGTASVAPVTKAGRGGRALSLTARGWMVAYWLVAGIMSFSLLTRIEGANTTLSGLTLLAVVTLAAGLARAFGVDLVEMIWWTTEKPAPTHGSAREPLLHVVR